MAEDPNQPHAYVRRRDTVLGEWCVDCGRGSWHPLHGEPAPTRRRQHDPSLLMEEPDLFRPHAALNERGHLRGCGCEDCERDGKQREGDR